MNEEKTWKYLTSIWLEYKSDKSTVNKDCISCLADSIKKKLGNIKTPEVQIESALQNSKNVEEFLYRSLLPQECLEEKQMAEIPKFATKMFPGVDVKFSEDALKLKIESLLESNIPIEIGICADKSYTENCDGSGGHSVALYGIKEVCSSEKKSCKKLVKIKNSYGNGWQKSHNDGWIDFDTIVKSSASLSTFNNITWIEKEK